MPEVHSIPVFTELLGRHDLTIMHVLTYGAIAALLEHGHEPSYRDVAELVGDRRGYPHNTTRDRVRDLVRAGLIRRVMTREATARAAGDHKRARTRFMLAGPVTKPIGNDAPPVARAS